jgi:hypothetical protein
MYRPPFFKLLVNPISLQQISYLKAQVVNSHLSYLALATGSETKRSS